MTQNFTPGQVLHAAELNGALATKADRDAVTGLVRAEQLPNIGAVVAEQTTAQLAALAATVVAATATGIVKKTDIASF